MTRIATDEDRALVARLVEEIGRDRVASYLNDLEPTPHDAPPDHAPVVRLWNVVGTVHYSGGFDTEITATTAAEARERIGVVIAAGEPGDFSAELLEVCVESCEEID